MLIDSHAHLNFGAFEKDLDEVVGRCNKAGLLCINVGSQYDTSRKAVQIAEENKDMFAAVGLHPIHAEEGFEAESYRSLTKIQGTVAIGEIGLDKFKDYGKFFDKQKKVFLTQLDLAKELNLPVVIHCRCAHKEMIEILAAFQLQGVIHCFTGTWGEAKKYLDMGFSLGINGIMYKMNIKETIQKMPLDRLLIETDCPYLVPPQARSERNEPLFVKYVAEDVAKLRGISFEEIARATAKNAQTLFNLNNKKNPRSDLGSN